MSHRAFAFRWSAFAAELKPLIEAGAIEPLERFVGGATDGDFQQLAGRALKRYYDPSADIGLGLIWQRFSDTRAVLGTVLPNFDPGKYGSYFQSEEQVRASIARIEPTLAIEGDELLKMLCTAAERGLGIYATF